ncbi:hypothetical protein Thimo_0683 [Thioflavicoccus mobilis 8321]|uniref:Uncharacterized protein n=1 Tax=Thioflavicoccus mobilis 8321 TaxID=765912 RepID=L0GUM5_9GAMM|nr:hypothetical protein Thimo_0683 [Thioflavicoccus mobilis 8321]
MGRSDILWIAVFSAVLTRRAAGPGSVSGEVDDQPSSSAPICCRMPKVFTKGPAIRGSLIIDL